MRGVNSAFLVAVWMLVLSGGMAVAAETVSVATNLTDSSHVAQWQLREKGNGVGTWNSAEEPNTLSLVGGEKGKAPFWLYPLVPTEFGRTYRLDVEVKARGQYRFYLESIVKPDLENYGILQWRKGTGAWEKYSILFRFNKVKHKPYLVLAMQGQGTAYFRNLVLRPITASAIDMKSECWSSSPGVHTTGETLEMTCAEPEKIVQIRHDAVKLEPGCKYTLSCESLGIAGKGDSAGAHWFRFYPVWDKNVPEKLKLWQDTLASNQTKRLEFTVPPKVVAAEIVVELRGPGMIRLEKFKLEPIKEPPQLAIELDLPVGYRNQAIAAVATFVSGELFAARLKGAQIEFNYRDADGKILQQIAVSNGSSMRFSVPLPTAGKTHFLTATAYDASGKLLSEAKRAITALAADGKDITFNAQGIAIVDGKKFFPIGLWGSIGRGTFADEFRFLREAGFNVMGVRADSNTLDIAKQEGFKIFQFGYVPGGRTCAEKCVSAEKDLSAIRRHPALLAYLPYDEPLWGGRSREELEDTYTAIRQADPAHPVFINEAPRNVISLLRNYARNTCDIYGVDIYPVPEGNSHSELENRGLGSVGAYTARCVEVVNRRKPVWMTLQAFAWNRFTNLKLPPEAGNYPTWEQSRFMAYDAVINGAQGLLYWSLNVGHSERFWQDLRKVTRELSYMSSILVADTVLPAKLHCDDQNLRIMQKKLDGKDYFLVVNRSKKIITTKFSGLPPKTKMLYVLLEEHPAIVNHGSFTLTFPAYGVKVFASVPWATAETIFSLATYSPFYAPISKEPEVELLSKSLWIWHPERKNVPGSHCLFRRILQLECAPVKAQMVLAADDRFELLINGEKIGSGGNWSNIYRFNLMKRLSMGNAVIEIKGENGSGACGVIAALQLDYADGSTEIIRSDRKWMTTDNSITALSQGDWRPAEELAAFNTPPWNAGRFSIVAGDAQALAKGNAPAAASNTRKVTDDR